MLELDSLEESVSVLGAYSHHGHGGMTVWYSSVLIICAQSTYVQYIFDIIAVITKVEVQDHLKTPLLKDSRLQSNS